MMPQRWQQLQRVFNVHHPLQRDPLIRFKRCGENVILKLRKIEDHPSNESREVVDPNFAKYRMASAHVESIYDLEKDTFTPFIHHRWNNGRATITYQQDKVAFADLWINDKDVCSHGIHYFQTLEGAYFYDWLEGCVKFIFLNGLRNHFIVFDHNGNVDTTNLLKNPIPDGSPWIFYPYSSFFPLFS